MLSIGTINKQKIVLLRLRLGLSILLLGFFILNGADVFAQSSNVKLVKTAKELDAAFVNALPGDAIVMRNGVWKDIDILVKGEGTEEKPITLKAETPGQVVISGKSSVRLSGRHLVVDGLYFKYGHSSAPALIRFYDGKNNAYHSRVTNIAVFNYSRKKEDKSEFWIAIRGSHNRVDHSFFCGKVSAGKLITIGRAIDSADYHRIDHNYFKDVPLLGKNGAEAIGIGWSQTSLSDSYTTVEYNLFENCNGEGELIGLKSGRNVIRHNTIFRSQGSISLRHGNNNLVENNFIFGGRVKNTGGIRVMGEAHIIRNNYVERLRGERQAIALIEGWENTPLHGYYQLKDITVEGNVLVDNDYGITVGANYKRWEQQVMPVMNSNIKSNVVVGVDDKSRLIEVLDEPINMVYEGNVVYKGQSIDRPGIKRADPKLVLKDGIYEHSKKSPVKGNIVGSPLKRTDVGPSWIKGRWQELGIEDIPYNNH